MNKNLVEDVIAVGLITAGVYHLGCRLYEKGVNSVINDIVKNDFKVINADGDEMGFKLIRRTFLGKRMVANL